MFHVVLDFVEIDAHLLAICVVLIIVVDFLRFCRFPIGPAHHADNGLEHRPLPAEHRPLAPSTIIVALPNGLKILGQPAHACHFQLFRSIGVISGLLQLPF